MSSVEYKNTSGLPTVIFGMGGASKGAYYLLKKLNEIHIQYDFLGFISNQETDYGKDICDGYKVISLDYKFVDFTNRYEKLGVVIPFGDPQLRRGLFEKIEGIENIIFPNLIHPSAIFSSPFASIGQGNIVAAGTIFEFDIEIEDFNYFNMGCTIGHDVKMGSFNTVNPLASISGGDTFGDCNLIGVGGVVLQNLNIADQVVLGGGGVITKDVSESGTLVGIPAKRLKK